MLTIKRSRTEYQKSYDKLRYQKRVSEGLCVFCGKLPARNNGRNRRCEVCENMVLHNAKVKYNDMKSRVFSHYGMHCNCCGESEILFLHIDHIDGGGRQHRKEVGDGLGFYAWLVNNNFPEGFQTLCANCNDGKRRNKNVCPHKEKVPCLL